MWKELMAPAGHIYSWHEDSTYIHDPPFFKNVEKAVKPVPDINEAYCLLNLGDSITTDHISPAGKISS